MSSTRKQWYKSPPTTSQAARRAKALEEQKKKRHEKYDKERQLELFVSQLSIANSDDEESETKPKKSRGNKWANRCMYAEPLEMDEHANSYDTDGLPSDLTSPGQWIAVAPVPVGKRCLAIVHQSPGPSGATPNTTLRSRAYGKTILRPFPSHLPPNTILDCIIDQDWRQNGRLHVLDVLRWKGQDIRGCEVPFRFWWRDTRLSEVIAMLPTKSHPTIFTPVPYYPDLSLSTLSQTIIPVARTGYSYSPVLGPAESEGDQGDMELDSRAAKRVNSDGILLYVAQATYEEGPSALAHWVSLSPLSEDSASPMDTFERLIQKRIEAASGHNVGTQDDIMDV